MKKLLLIPLLLWSAFSFAQFTPGQVLTAAELNNQFALYAPLGGATFTGPVTIPTLTTTTSNVTTSNVTNANVTNLNVSGTFTIPASTVLPNGVTATTQGFLDSSTKVSTTAFTKQTVLAAMATIPIASFTGGTYNFATAGTGGTMVVFALTGNITSILSIVNPGTGYQVGDCLIMVGGNGDAIVRVTAVSGGGITAASPIYGGTGYTTGATVAGSPLPPGSRTANLNGVLTSNATVIIPAGTYLQGGRRVGFQNNTTGAFTTTVKLSNGAGGSTGTGVVLPQGIANSTSMLLYTDGVTDVWPENGPGGIVGIPLSSLASQAANTVVANATGGSASPTAIAAPSCSTSSSALQWTSGTGLACNSAINSATLGGTAAASYALLASPTFTGTPAAPTAAAGTNTTQLATTANVVANFATPPTAGYGSTTPEPVAATTLAASGNDALLYQTTNALSIPNNTVTTVTTWTKVSDRVNTNFNAATGVFTAPVTGQYWVAANLTFAATTGGSTIVQRVQIVGNSVTLAQQATNVVTSTGVAQTVSISALVPLTAGQTIVIQAFQNSGSAVVLAVGAAANNSVSIVRIP